MRQNYINRIEIKKTEEASLKHHQVQGSNLLSGILFMIQHCYLLWQGILKLVHYTLYRYKILNLNSILTEKLKATF